MSKVKKQDTVSVHYTGSITDGEVFDSSREREPLVFKVGEGKLIPGFEQAVMGMEVKETKKVTIPSDKAYGPVRKELIQKVPKEQLPDHIDPEVGQRLVSKTPEGKEIVFNVVDVATEEITVDANHPLAGKDLDFEIEVLEIR